MPTLPANFFFHNFHVSTFYSTEIDVIVFYMQPFSPLELGMASSMFFVYVFSGIAATLGVEVRIQFKKRLRDSFIKRLS